MNLARRHCVGGSLNKPWPDLQSAVLSEWSGDSYAWLSQSPANKSPSLDDSSICLSAAQRQYLQTAAAKTWHHQHAMMPDRRELSLGFFVLEGQVLSARRQNASSELMVGASIRNRPCLSRDPSCFWLVYQQQCEGSTWHTVCR